MGGRPRGGPRDHRGAHCRGAPSACSARLHSPTFARPRSSAIHATAHAQDDEHPPLGCSVDVRDPNGMTILHWLAIEAHNDVIEWIIDEVGADIELGDLRYGQTALHFGASKDNGRVVEQLLQRGANARANDKAGWTPLHTAARAGALDAAAPLMKALDSAAINARGPGGQTPLHRAAFWGHAELAAALLDAGADRGALDDRGRPAVEIACDGGEHLNNLPALQKLLRSPPPRYKDQDPLAAAS